MTDTTRGSAGGRTGRAPGSEQGPSAPTPRPATPQDVAEILRLVRELADYEHSLDEVVATEELLGRLLFGALLEGPRDVVAAPPSGERASGVGPGPGPRAYCHVVDAPEQPRGAAAPALAAFALWFTNASTWLARPGIYLEDLYVSPAFRGHGFGRALMATLAAICVERGYGRLEWWVLDWNRPAIDFYRSLGARPMDEWTVHRLTGPALAELAATVAGRPQDCPPATPGASPAADRLPRDPSVD